MTFIILLFLLSTPKSIFANSNFDNSCPPCLVGNVYVDSQDEVNDWVALNGGCNKIQGTLKIGPGWNTPSDINDISGFLGLEEVTGGVFIQYTTGLTSLEGLNDLQKIGGSLYIDNTSNLNDISALGNIQEINSIGRLRIKENNNLQNLSGLHGLSQFADLEITGNYNLTSLDGLNNLTQLEEIIIEDNVNLTSIQSLVSLTNVTGSIDITGNSDLPNLLGLEGLDFIFDLLVSNNAQLQNLQGLHNLDTIGNGGIQISACPMLTNLSGLESLEFIYEDLILSNNGFTSLQGLENLDSIGEAFWLDDNNFLLSLEGLENLKIINANFLIRRNGQLATLTGVENLEKVLAYFQIIDNDVLPNLNGLSGLTEVSHFQIEKNDILTSLTGLNSTTNFNGLFYLVDNNSLSDISAIEDYTYFETLRIWKNPSLESLNSFSNVAHLGSFYFRDNPLITSFDGFENLNTIQGFLYIGKNEALENVHSLRALNYIGDYLQIEDNSSLKNLQGFNNLETILGNLEINENETLHELRGLTKLKTIGGNFRLVENPSLYKINSLFDLQSIGSHLLINENDILQNIDGIDKLTFVGDWFSVINNPELSECSVHFICRRLINGGTVTLGNNKEGCNDDIQILENCGISTFKGTVAIDDNLNCEFDQGDFSLQGWKVIATSADYENVTFTNAQGVYIMNVDTGTYNVNVISPSSIWQPCINNQSYVFSENYDTINVDLVNQGLVDCPIMAVDMNSTPLRECGNATFFVDYCNFGTATGNDAYVDVYLNDFLDIEGASLPYTLDGYIATFPLGDVAPGSCSNFTINMKVSCEVVFNQTICATAWIYPDSTCEIPSSAWAGDDLFVGSFCGLDEIVLEIENAGTGDMQIPVEYRVFRNGIPHEVGTIQLLAGESQEITFPRDGATYRMEVDQVSNHPKITSPGATVEACPDDNNNFETGYAMQLPVEDYDASFDRYCLPISASLDPNDKRGFPLGYGTNAYIEENTPIDYHIRFQNTGNDTAFLVVILDTLPSYLDPNSIELKGASHDYKVELLENNIIEFRFENILLPDSTTNEIESNGFVSFLINQQPDLPFGTEIINSAAIYFDYNEAVITEYSIHQVGYETYTSNEIINLCEGESYEGVTYLKDTTLVDSLDFGVVIKVDQTTINVTPAIQLMVDTMITIGDPYDGVVYLSDTTLLFPFMDQNGCDSIVSINILVNPVGVNSLEKKSISVNIFPNPISDVSYFEIINASINLGRIKIYNSIGQQVRGTNIYQNKFEFSKGQLSPGVYYYKIELEDQTVLAGKFSIE